MKTLIITGGEVTTSFFKKTIAKTKFDKIIASDKGLEILDKCNIEPNYIIGDFDSINIQILNKYINNKNIEIKKLNPEKDYTDTHMALKLALKIKSTEIVILGAIGTRIDHTVSNIHILKEALKQNVKCKIINNKNEIELINKKTVIKNIEYKYISLIPLTTKVKGITLKGFKYPLKNDILKIGQSIGISNEQLIDNAEINIKKGILILIKSKD